MGATAGLPEWMRESAEKHEQERQAAIAAVLDETPCRDLADRPLTGTEARRLADHVRLMNKVCEIQEGMLVRADYTIETQRREIAELKRRLDEGGGA